ncbi:MAG: Crp/Fnr family transcriptional regulator [Solobacterium sp.]|nr:Crp/Fnr family transcriptional regulator [Solobacterium sp.]
MNVNELASCAMFKGISPHEIEQYLNLISYRIETYEKGESVFHLMEDATHIAIILQGKVQIQKIFPSGKEMQVNMAMAGDMIGEAAVFSRQQKYPCELVALTHSELLLLERDEMLKLLHSDLRLLNNFISDLSTAAFQLQHRIELLSYSGIQQKIAFYLLSHSMRLNTAIVPIPESISKWALVMNVSRPSLHRELKDMEQHGLIKIAAPNIIILDTQALRAVLE